MQPSPWHRRIAVLGSPDSRPDYSPARLARLLELGFDTVQVNIAWLSRPHDEPLNLSDVVAPAGVQPGDRVAERLDELRARTRAAQEVGLRTLFHFGSPFMWRDPATGRPWQPDDPLGIDRSGAESRRWDTEDPAVVDHEAHLVAQLREACPELDDLLVYTFDQDAWQASEFGLSPLSRGVPLTERLPRFLHRLHEAWAGDRDGHTLHWEPWELSAGQVLTILPALPRTAFGLMVHSNIAEVQLALPGDVWLRNTARVAADLGIPVVVEAFLAERHEEIEPLRLPTPRLVDEQLRTLGSIRGVTGIKEYYGLDLERTDLNLDVAAARLRGDDAPIQAVVARTLARSGFPPELAAVAARVDDGYQLVPWDTSWFLRKLGHGVPRHGWDLAILRGEVISTPSWDSTRRALFMKTDDQPPHASLMEDVYLRIDLAVESFVAAAELLVECGPGADGSAFAAYRVDLLGALDSLTRTLTAFSLHLRESVVAQLLREDLATEGRPSSDRLRRELVELLDRDVENSFGEDDAVRARDLAQTDVAAFLASYLLPAEDGSAPLGLHSLTTI